MIVALLALLGLGLVLLWVTYSALERTIAQRDALASRCRSLEVELMKARQVVRRG